MNSHEYARKLGDLSAFLLSRPEFETSNLEENSYIVMWYWNQKEEFLGAVKSIGAGVKQYDKDDLKYVPAATDMLRLIVNRTAVCRKVQDEKWECEPLLSAEEDASVGVEVNSANQ